MPSPPSLPKKVMPEKPFTAPLPKPLPKPPPAPAVPNPPLPIFPAPMKLLASGRSTRLRGASGRVISAVRDLLTSFCIGRALFSDERFFAAPGAAFRWRPVPPAGCRRRGGNPPVFPFPASRPRPGLRRTAARHGSAGWPSMIPHRFSSRPAASPVAVCL